MKTHHVRSRLRTTLATVAGLWGPSWTAALGLSSLVFAWPVDASARQAQSGRQPDQRPAAKTELRTFFGFEREIWLETSGSEVKLQTPTRHPHNPVIARGEGQAVDSHRLSFTSMLPENGKLRAWYTALRTGATYTDHMVAYAESEDGIHWVKPELNLPDGGANVLLRGPIIFVVVADETEQGKVYRALTGFFRADVGTPAAAGRPGITFKMLTSSNGLEWDFDKEPAIETRHFEAYGLFRRQGKWWVLGQGVSPYFHLPDGRAHSRVMYGFYSHDTVNWELYPRPLFQYPVNSYFPDSSLQNHLGAAVWDRGRVLIGLVGQLWPGGFTGTVRITAGLVYSYDGIKWVEPFAQTPFLSVGPKDSWDGGAILPVQTPVSRGDLTYLYYSGFDGGNAWSSRSSIGLATLRRDGLVAVVPQEDKAYLVTKPLSLAPGETTLYLNSRGGVTVQVLDTYLKPISPEKRIHLDGVRIPAADLQQLALGNGFCLAFKLEKDAEFFTFSFGPAPSELPSSADWQ